MKQLRNFLKRVRSETRSTLVKEGFSIWSLEMILRVLSLSLYLSIAFGCNELIVILYYLLLYEVNGLSDVAFLYLFSCFILFLLIMLNKLQDFKIP